MATARSVVSLSFVMILFITQTLSDDPSPVFDLCGAANFDVRNLTNTEWTFSLLKEDCLIPRNKSSESEESCRINMNFCQAVHNIVGCENSAVCEIYEPKTYLPYNLATYKNFTNPYNTSGLKSGVGFTTSYQFGEEYQTPENKTCTLTTVMTFLCNMTVTWNKALPNDVVNTVPVVPKVQFIHEDKLCTYNFTFDFAGACPLIIPSNLPPQMSPGAILLMIFIVSVVLYITLGVFVNMARGKMGLDACPHPTFWTMLFVYIQDGIQFTFSCCGKKSGPSYESI